MTKEHKQRIKDVILNGSHGLHMENVSEEEAVFLVELLETFKEVIVERKEKSWECELVSEKAVQLAAERTGFQPSDSPNDIFNNKIRELLKIAIDTK